jgi:hypothetical protein
MPAGTLLLAGGNGVAFFGGGKLACLLGKKVGVLGFGKRVVESESGDSYLFYETRSRAIWWSSSLAKAFSLLPTTR